MSNIPPSFCYIYDCNVSSAITDATLETSDVTTPKSQEAADANPHFISTIKPYTLRFPVLVRVILTNSATTTLATFLLSFNDNSVLNLYI